MPDLCLIRGFSRCKALGNLFSNNGALKKIRLEETTKKKEKKIENRGVAGEFLKAVYNSSCLFCSALSQVELIRATLVLSASRPLGLIFLFLYLCNAIFSLL